MAWSRDPDRYRGVPRALAKIVRARDNYECQVCGRDAHLVDHIINVKRGGTDDLDNLQVLCQPCHDEKTAREREAGRQLRSGKRTPARHPGLG